MTDLLTPPPSRSASEGMLRDISIVVLGATLSGKTTFIETTKQYADQSYQIDDNFIGHGNNPHTRDIRNEQFQTSLPKYHVVEPLETPTIIHPCELIDQFNDVCDYEDFIKKKYLSVLSTEQEPETVSFTLVDTPGVTGVSRLGRQIEPNLGPVISIFNAVTSRNKVSLLLVTVPPGPFTAEFRQAIQCCTDMFSELNSVIAFLHTKIHYKDLHPRNSKSSLKLRSRRAELQNIIKRSTFLEFHIDCDTTNSTQAIRACITYNIIKEILQAAAFNEPVTMTQAAVNKTPQMKQIDRLFLETYKAMLKENYRTLRIIYDEFETVLSQLFNVQTDIVKTEGEQFTGGSEPVNLIFPDQEHVIAQVDILANGIDIISTSGGKDYKYWNINFRTRCPQSGSFHVRIYCKKSEKYSEEIEKINIDIQSLEEDIINLQKSMTCQKESAAKLLGRIQEQIERRELHLRLIDWLTRDALPKEIFQALADHEAYMGATAKMRQKLEKVYIDFIYPKSSESSMDSSNVPVQPPA
ncbi:hypothetical protein BGX27_001730 [Mortierella sp. AM989]|nr:hypothetical protein BGX27_001730 [Mortierella sp. AM989]